MGGGHQVCLPVTAGSPPSLGGGSVCSLIMSDLGDNQSAAGFHSHPGKNNYRYKPVTHHS